MQASFFTATTDLWTSCCNDAYITFTGHFISSEWELHTFCLETVPMYSDHTGRNIADTISAILENWDLCKDKMVAATTDSGSNIVLAFKILHAVRISCFGHNLDLVIKEGLDTTRIKIALGRYVTHLWKCFIAVEKSPEISGRNRKSLACHNIKLLVMLQLIGDLHMRWYLE